MGKLDAGILAGGEAIAKIGKALSRAAPFRERGASLENKRRCPQQKANDCLRTLQQRLDEWLQVLAMPVLQPLLLSNKKTLSLRKQKILAAWATMFTMVYETVN